MAGADVARDRAIKAMLLRFTVSGELADIGRSIVTIIDGRRTFLEADGDALEALIPGMTTSSPTLAGHAVAASLNFA